MPEIQKDHYNSTKEIPSHTKVVVIGGGVVGCSILFHLAIGGITNDIKHNHIKDLLNLSIAIIRSENSLENKIQSICDFIMPVIAPCLSGEHQTIASLQLTKSLSSETLGCVGSASSGNGNPVGLNVFVSRG